MRSVTAWYLERYYQSPADIGVPAMFCDPTMVGHFAVDARALARGDAAALFRLLVTMTMFQRRSDQQILRVLRGMSREDAQEVTAASTLLLMADEVECPHVKELEALKERCDVYKDPVSKRGRCGERPTTPCHVKRHTELLKRYGHFGKVPTSAALTLRAHEADSLCEIQRQIWTHALCPRRRAIELEASITRSWRVSDKIAAMFLSAVTNCDLSHGLAPWAEGVDTSCFVVVDSNVDLFLREIGYSGSMTYRARRRFVQRLARRVRLDELRQGLVGYNPRLVQQAIYMFMSESNRRASARDCSREGARRCAACAKVLSQLCRRRREAT